MKTSHPLWQTARSLKGNQRACIVSEPLWAVPNNLFLPFASVYMAAIGLQDVQIGMVASLGLAVQFLWAVFSGAIVDKYGRRRTLLIFGLLAWTIPCMLWAAAQEYWWFMLAAFFNGMWRVTGNSFSCMIVEDGDTDQLINIYTILSLIGLLAGFLSPAIGLFIDRFSLVDTMRVVYTVGMIMMTVKFLLQFRMSRESEIGVYRMSECKGRPLLSLTFGGWSTFASALKETRLVQYVALMAFMTCFNTVQAAFWPLFVTTAFQVNASMLSVFPLVKAVTTIAVYLLITSYISMRSIRRPLLAGFGAQALGLAVLVLCRPLGAVAVGAVFFSAICEAFAIAILSPLCESLLSVTIPAQERARINSLITAMILLISMPIGWIAGQLSQHNRMLPLILNLCLLSAEIFVAFRITQTSKQGKRADVSGPE